METILAGDVGGTFSRLAMMDRSHPSEPRYSQIYASDKFGSLQEIIEIFLRDAPAEMKQGSLVGVGLGVAGPVDGQVAKITNLPWRVEQKQIVDQIGTSKVVILNDFAAISHAIPHLEKEALHGLGGGKRIPGEPIAVIGAGTGLGEGILIWNNNRYISIASEGGHKDFAPRSSLEIRLLQYLTEKFGRVSFERILSGPGLINIYDFLVDVEGMVPENKLEVGSTNEDPAAEISKRGLQQSDPVCDRALNIFCTIYGAEAGNLALQCLAKGGVYLAGGIATKILPRLEEGGFRTSFENKGRFREFLETVPTWVITHPQPGLLGAALAAAEL